MSDKQQKAPYPLRMPDEMRDKLKEAAHNNRRSLNAEIVARLEQSIHDQVDNDELIDGYSKEELEGLGLSKSLIEDIKALNIKVDSLISHFAKKTK